MIFPDRFSSFIWNNYWGPVVADARGGYIDGVKEGLNPVSALTYAFLLIFSIYLIYRTLKRYRVIMDFRLVLASVPFAIAGAFSRVLEDAGMIEAPAVYFFISPIIYIWLGIL